MFQEFMIRDIARMIKGKTEMIHRDLIRGISINSKATKSGDLFFALKGEHTDGHCYAKDALLNGALAVVVEKHTDVKSEILVTDTLFALGKFAEKYRSLFNPKTIAVTGTNGKTTVKNLIGAILSKKYRTVYTKKSFNSLIGLPLTIFDLSPDEEYLVIEMGTSNPGEIKRLCEIARPHIGVITNVGPGHLKGLGSIEGVRREKLSLIESLPDDGFVLIGEGVGEVKGANVVSFSLDLLANVQLDECGSTFVFHDMTFFTPLLGIGSVYNCFAAVYLTSKLGIEYDDQCAVLADIKPEPGRMEPIHRNGFFIINDTYNANPVSMKTAIDYTAVIQRRKVFVLGDMLELGKHSKKLHQEIGRYARKYSDLLLTYGDEAQCFNGKHFRDKSVLIHYLRDNLYGDELILVKASRGLRFESIVEDLLRRL